jgi:uncharacterized protein YfiM (DUF2279 family)
MYKQLIFSTVFLLASFSSQADEWTGQDKSLHFIAGAGVGIIGNAIDSPKVGCISGFVVGTLKEGYDSLHPESHTVSMKDMLVTALGACTIANVSGLVFGPGWIKYKINF